jgi:hypothetical protein
LILYDEDTMHTCLVTVRLELDNGTLTWSGVALVRVARRRAEFCASVRRTKPPWDTHRTVDHANGAHQGSSDAAHYSILMKRYVLRDVASVDLDDGFLQLSYVKHIRSGILHCDLLPIIKRYKLNDISNPDNCFTIVYGASISENRFARPARRAPHAFVARRSSLVALDRCASSVRSVAHRSG